jgi:hypothetical protein
LIHTIPYALSGQPYGFGSNTTHYIVTHADLSKVSILDSSLAGADNWSTAANRHNAADWYNNSWWIGSVSWFYRYTPAGSYMNENFSTQPQCYWFQAIDYIDNKFYLDCSDGGAGSNVSIVRYNADGTYDNYRYNVTENEGGCIGTTGIGEGFMTLMSSGLDQTLYLGCKLNVTPQWQLYGYDIDYANTTQNYTSTPANLTLNVIEAEKQILGVRNQGDALMLWSFAISGGLAFMAVFFIRKQPLILFTIFFIMGMVTFSYIGWLPIAFLFIVVVISAIILAFKLRSVFIGEG